MMANEELKRVFLVGGAGRIGTTVRKGLAERYDFSGMDVVPSDEPEIATGDARDLATIEAALEGQDAVIYLPNMNREPGTWEQGYENDLPAIWNTFEAARRNGLKRVIFCSSNRATEKYEHDYPYANIMRGELDGLDPNNIPYVTPSSPVRPQGPYGIVKVFGEVLGRWFSDTYGMSVICIRVGRFTGSAEPGDVRQVSVLLTPRDAVHLFDRCLQAPDDVKFAVFYGVSNNKWRIWDISEAQRLIGYEPQDNLEEWRDKLKT
jgi:nucleoside-diphosphate-sugar epimerase